MLKLSRIKEWRLKYLATHKKLQLTFGLVILFSLVGLTLDYAWATTSISQSYLTSEKLSIGSIVSLKTGTNNQVIPSTSSNIKGLIGVVISSDNSAISISGSGENQAQVATNGTMQVLVSDINGDIEKGDYITASPIGGVGMKATSSVRVVGIAQDDLNSKNGSKQTYKEKNGTEKTVLVGQIPALINVSYYTKETEKTLIPRALQNVANALAGRTVSPVPIIISVVIFVVMMIVVVSIIYTMIRSSIISIGRNPMSQSAVYRDLIQLSALVVIILAVGITAIYLVLTRMQ